MRPPRSLAAVTPDPFEAEVLAEKAAGLGRSGRKVETALELLAAADKGGAERPRLLKDAVEAVYFFFIQRELCGLRDHRPAIEHYRIRREVLARLGAA